jgi:hypothetical protein
MKNQRSIHIAHLLSASLLGASGTYLNTYASNQDLAFHYLLLPQMASSLKQPDGSTPHKSQVSASQAADCPGPTNDTGNSIVNDQYLPSGFYDALENPISEEEYWRQIEYEQKSGIPFVRDKDVEKANLQKPVSLLVHPEIECAGDIVTHITKQGTCYREAKGQSVFVNSLPSNCEVITFTDDRCRDDPLDMIPFLNAASGCYSTDGFESVRVDCRPLPL